MSHSYSKKGSRLYRYYVCHRAQKQGWDECPAPSLPAGEIEGFVVDQIKRIGRDPAVIRDTLAQVRRQTETGVERLTSERSDLVRQVRAEYAKLGKLAAEAVGGDPRLAEAHDRIRLAERRVTEIDDELATLRGEVIDEAEVSEALADFDGLWGALSPGEQARIIELLVDRVTYDGHAGKLSITYRPSGIRTLASEIADSKEDAA